MYFYYPCVAYYYPPMTNPYAPLYYAPMARAMAPLPYGFFEQYAYRQQPVYYNHALQQPRGSPQPTQRFIRPQDKAPRCGAYAGSKAASVLKKLNVHLRPGQTRPETSTVAAPILDCHQELEAIKSAILDPKTQEDTIIRKITTVSKDVQQLIQLIPLAIKTRKNKVLFRLCAAMRLVFVSYEYRQTWNDLAVSVKNDYAVELFRRFFSEDEYVLSQDEILFLM